jgi:hypothetical protein
MILLLSYAGALPGQDAAAVDVPCEMSVDIKDKTFIFSGVWASMDTTGHAIDMPPAPPAGQGLRRGTKGSIFRNRNRDRPPPKP